jgi:amino acid transporter
VCDTVTNKNGPEYSTPVALVMCIIILFTAGFPVFTKGNWSAVSFVSSYL